MDAEVFEYVREVRQLVDLQRTMLDINKRQIATQEERLQSLELKIIKLEEEINRFLPLGTKAPSIGICEAPAP